MSPNRAFCNRCCDWVLLIGFLFIAYRLLFMFLLAAGVSTTRTTKVCEIRRVNVCPTVQEDNAFLQRVGLCGYSMDHVVYVMECDLSCRMHGS